MPEGKSAGVRCMHLKEDLRCGIYEQRPDVCRKFRAEELVCGKHRLEALDILSLLENGDGRRSPDQRVIPGQTLFPCPNDDPLPKR